MERKICINTQTPLVRFKITQDEIVKRIGQFSEPLDLKRLREGDEYQFMLGGVTRMVFPFIKKMLTNNIISDAHWVSLNRIGSPLAAIEGITLHHVILREAKMKGYGHTKEAIYNTFLGMKQNESSEEVLWRDEFSDYTYYNRLSTEKIRRLEEEKDFDVFYIHDFQQLPVGHMLQTLKPKIFRWHITFDESIVPSEWKDLLSTYFNSYDTVIVSCKKYLKSLEYFGYTGKARYIYPYIDSSPYVKPPDTELDKFCRDVGLEKDDKVILVVARLDPIKKQDVVIKAMARVIKDIHNVKLLLAGNGSFSSSKNGGIGLSKAEKWADKLGTLASDLNITEHVVFTGNLSQDKLNCAYQRCDLTVLSSISEGFGLVVLESWLFKKPTIVTSTSGIAELIVDGENGLLFEPDNYEALAEMIADLLTNTKKARILGEKGFAISKRCLIERGVKEETKVIFDEV